MLICREKEKARLHEKQMKLKNEARLAASLPPEPLASDRNVVHVRIRFPRSSEDGEHKVELRRSISFLSLLAFIT